MNDGLRMASIVAVTAMALVLTGGVPAFAGQGDVETTCGDNRVCMWEDNNFGGNKWVDQSAPNGKVYDIDWWNGDNEISSIRNTSDYYICVYPGDYTWGGGYIIINPNREYGNLAQSFGFDNDAESFKVVDTTTKCI